MANVANSCNGPGSGLRPGRVWATPAPMHLSADYYSQGEAIYYDLCSPRHFNERIERKALISPRICVFCCEGMLLFKWHKGRRQWDAAGEVRM